MTSTWEDILNLDPVLKALAQAIFDIAKAEATRLNAQWALITLDVRYAPQSGGFFHKLRMGLVTGMVVSLKTPVDVALLLIELEKVRGAGDQKCMAFS